MIISSWIGDLVRARDARYAVAVVSVGCGGSPPDTALVAMSTSPGSRAADDFDAIRARLRELEVEHAKVLSPPEAGTCPQCQEARTPCNGACCD